MRAVVSCKQKKDLNIPFVKDTEIVVGSSGQVRPILANIKSVCSEILDPICTLRALTIATG